MTGLYLLARRNGWLVLLAQGWQLIGDAPDFCLGHEAHALILWRPE